MQIREVMSRSVETLGPEATLQEAAQRMRQADVGVMPVARNGEALGVVTDRDIAVRAVAEGLDPSTTTVGQIMTTDVTFCHESDDIADAAATMRQRQIRRLLVLDDSDRLCGIVSLGDLALRSGDDTLTEDVLEDVSRPTHPPRQVASRSSSGTGAHGWAGAMPSMAGAESAQALAMAAAGAALGAGLMYLLDPQGGRRRRALIRDKAYSKTRHTSERLRRRTQDAANRARGVAVEAARPFHRETPDDRRLAERVRAHLGRVATHPRAISVFADQGCVTVGGPILSHEADRLLSSIASVPGVQEVVDALERHDSPEGIPSLQGEGRQQRQSQRGAGGLGSKTGAALGLAGLGLLGAMLARRGAPIVREWAGASEDAGVHVHKMVEIDAPVEEVFAYWSNFENFPQFMRNVREVTVLGDGRSHWTVEGPAGATVEWDAEICEWIDGQRIAWESAEDATVENAGVVTFTPTESGGTRVDVHLAYRPPAGALGHLIAKAFGSDPRSEMDADLQRLKERIESQRGAGGAGATYRETVVAVATTPAANRGNLSGGGASGGGTLGDAGLASGEPDTSDI